MRTTMTSRGGLGSLALLLTLAASAGCVGPRQVAGWANADCHAADRAFTSFVVEQEGAPGFKGPILETAVTDALLRRGLRAAPNPATADVRMRVRVSMIRRGGAASDGQEPDSDARWLREAGAADSVARFVAHADLELVDRRSADRLIWKGALERPHIVDSDRTFHAGAALEEIGETLDAVFAGITEPCPAPGDARARSARPVPLGPGPAVPGRR